MRLPARSADTEALDAFFVSAPVTVILIRIFLEATGYPRLGGAGLHIAHVLWGGLGMLVAIVLLLLFLSARTRIVAAILGGAGFGAFIDEVGKFVTSDNDYFFKPAPALMYVTFVLLFLVVRRVRDFRRLSAEESLVNAIELSEELATGTLTRSRRARALALLDGADQSDPLVVALRARFSAAVVVEPRTSTFRRVAHSMSQAYARVAGSRWFRRVVAAIFVVQGLAFVLSVVAVLVMLAGAALGVEDARAALDETTGGSTVSSWIQVVAGLVAGALIIRGVLVLRQSRQRAYRRFELAILVDLMLAQPFAFLDTGFAATFAVLVDVLLLAALRYLEGQEHLMAASHAPGPVLAATH